MKPRRILPYYHPSTVIFVDDNERFLDSFTLLLSERLAVRCFSSTSAALSFINDNAARPPLDKRCVSFLGAQHRPGGTLRLDLALVEQEISNPDRFSDISVVVVDYDMPEMSGLDFCQAINSRRVKKVLLTGVGDEKVAVRAFNDGLIDRFLTKNDPQIQAKINQTIDDLQRRHFEDISSLIQSTLEMKSPEFLLEDEFIFLFQSLIQQYDIVEYYYVEDPNGFLMVSHQGELYRLIVVTESQADEQIFSVRKYNPPQEVINSLKSHRSIIWLCEQPDENDESGSFDWNEYVHKAHTFQGSKPWLYTLVENPPADIEYSEGESSYSAHLKAIDQQG
ncbi:response regulator [Alcanivorax sp. 1008]|uniref:response regulator n=1 Tax=Alcanivorax sp. 1008 TaxID=2816853 RepID=UPI001D57F93A|nr:response regulator [Alcanivorax sp. 1008]MCC1497042.1 response regulator [Alcanivorax sp. 1008]